MCDEPRYETNVKGDEPSDLADRLKDAPIVDLGIEPDEIVDLVRKGREPRF